MALARRFGRGILLPLLVIVVVVLTAAPVGATNEVVPAEVTVIVFYGDGCPFCDQQHVFLDDLSAEYPDLVVEAYEVWYDPANARLFRETAERMGFTASAVPTAILGDAVWVGFSDRIAADMRRAVEAAFAGLEPDPEPATIWLPFFGDIVAEEVSLLVATVAIGIVDGFNPCSLWALTILLALVVRGGSRRRVAAVAGTFLVVTAAIYGAFILGMYGALTVVAHMTWIRVAVAGLALAFGIVNVKDYFAFRSGFSLSIPEGKKAPLYARMRRVLADGQRLPVVIGGTVGLAAGVALIELPCTAGLPVLWSNLVAGAGVEGSTVLGLLGVYMLMYLLDELVIVGAVVIAMQVTKLHESHGRVLKLISGWMMIALAVTVIAVPRALESLAGVTLIVGAAAVLTGVSMLLRPVRAPRPPAGGDGRRRRPAGGRAAPAKKGTARRRSRTRMR